MGLNKEKEVPFEVLRGLTLKEIRGWGVGSEEISFVAEDGSSFRLYHEQNCCEDVQVEEIAGDMSDLIGTPILLAEETTSENVNPEGVKVPERQDSFTWTFYKLATIKGSVTIRWYGESNGYYSESVSFYEVSA